MNLYEQTPGECPYLTSRYVYEFVTGMQDGDDPRYLKVAACCKHYAAYDLENWHGVDRHHFNAVVTDEDIADTYFPAFQTCTQDAKSAGMMCSYNEVNGVPSCADGWLMTDVARGEWSFDGYITSDCGAVSDIQYTHNYTSTTDETCQVSLRAGMDIDCGAFLPMALPAAVKSGAITEADLDRALTNLFRVRFRLGEFDPIAVQPYRNLSVSSINTPAHQQLAYEAAQQGIVLLKNDGTLPLSQSVNTVAMIGPNANNTWVMQGNYYGDAPYIITPTAGLQRQGLQVSYQEGCKMNSGDKSGFAAAEKAAKSADATVLVVGLDQSQESEGHDRDSIALPGVQNDLITAVAAAASGPVIVVVMSGGCVDLTAVKNNSAVHAILYTGYPSQSGGDALADVLLGKFNPAGRLTQTWYPASFTDAVSMFDMGMRPSASSPGRGYRFYTGPTVYTFGSGLSYTTFKYEWATAPAAGLTVSAGEFGVAGDRSWLQAKVTTSFSVTVTNTGKIAGDDVVLAFVTPPGAGTDGQPLKQLIGFERVHLKPGQSQSIFFSLRDVDIARPASKLTWSHVPGTYTITIGTSHTSSGPINATTSVIVA